MSPSREHGPLPAFLVGLTVVSGLVDAFSYLTLGHVFVSNMTGNVVFLGFALAGVGEISVLDSLLALLAFAVGATIAGRMAARRPPHRGRLLAVAAAVQALFMLIAGGIVLASAQSTSRRLILIAALALAMGGQNAVVRRLAVPEMPTTVMTRTIAGLAAAGVPRRLRIHQLASVIALLLGALMGGTLLRHATVSAPLWMAGLLLLAFAAGVYQLTRAPAAQTWR